MGKYFFDKKIGLNKDIERHREEKRRLDEKIELLENNPKRDKFVEASIRTYRNFRCILEQSLAEVVSKLGRKKR